MREIRKYFELNENKDKYIIICGMLLTHILREAYSNRVLFC